MREITFLEVDQVSGGTFGDYVGNVAAALCGAVTRGAGAAVGCAVIGTAVGQIADSVAGGDWSSAAPDMGNYYNNIPAGMQ